MSLQPIHAHRGGLDQHRIEPRQGVPLKQARNDAQRVICRVSHPKHPAVPGERAYALSHLVGQRLKGQLVVGLRKRAGDGLGKPA
jgi:hypothetical protein